MDALLQEQQNSVVDLVGAWKNGGVQQRQELALNLFPEGLRFSQQTLFFEPGNTLLMNIMHEMMRILQPKKTLERETGFEPATSTLARSHSTTELLPPLKTC